MSATETTPADVEAVTLDQGRAVARKLCWIRALQVEIETFCLQLTLAVRPKMLYTAAERGVCRPF